MTFFRLLNLVNGLENVSHVRAPADQSQRIVFSANRLNYQSLVG